MITVVFTSRAEFEAFKAATPETDVNPFTVIGLPAYETLDAQGMPAPASRVFVAHDFTADEAKYLQGRGADVRAGGIDGPVWPGRTLP